MNIYIGVDPGKKGYACMIDENNSFRYFAYDQIDSLRNHIAGMQDAGDNFYAAIEKVTSSPQMGVVSAFNFGANYGEWIGLFKGLGVPCQPVHIKTWQREFAMDNSISDPKYRALKAAQAIAPEQTFMSSDRAKKPNDNMVDAFLIATYAKRKL